MGMFCYQCQETSKGVGCNFVGVCGKTEKVANLQDFLVYAVKDISDAAHKAEITGENAIKIGRELIDALFMTITNANFDDNAIYKKYLKLITLKENLSLTDNELLKPVSLEQMLESAEKVSILRESNEDIRSLKELIVYGVKGLSAYAKHAYNLGVEDEEIYKFIFRSLSLTMSADASVENLIAMTLETGKYGVNAMAMLDNANTSKYGNPEITKVNIGVRNNPAILISGHDLKDLERLLEQTQGTGVDVYTHSEMLPAHYYPFFKKYSNFVGNYGNAWWKQTEEFASFNGAILFTTNCIVPPRNEALRSRIFTTGSSGYPNCKHIEKDENGNKDFSEVIEMAKKLPAPTQIENGEIIGGFAHNQVLALADKVVDAVKTGAIKRFVVMAGCDGRMKSRSYYTDFASGLNKDTVILTAGCAKYRYNKLDLRDIGGIPRVLDAGQCNDSYSLAIIALKLKEVFGLSDINDLPITYNIAWYEQKAVIVLLALLYLGVKNIKLGPTLPAFLSPNVVKVLVDTFNISGITSVEEDLKNM